MPEVPSSLIQEFVSLLIDQIKISSKISTKISTFQALFKNNYGFTLTENHVDFGEIYSHLVPCKNNIVLEQDTDSNY